MIFLRSHAINLYLAKVYDTDHKLYPSHPKEQAIVQHRLFYDTGVLYRLMNPVTVSDREEKFR